MRLILFDSPDEARKNFYPLALSHPIWELRYGFDTLGDKLAAKVGENVAGYFLAEYMADVYGEKTDKPVNDASVLGGDDLLLIDARVKADSFDVSAKGASEVGLDKDGNVLYARIAKDDLGKLTTSDICTLLESAKANLPSVGSKLACWQYIWDLVLANPDQLTIDFKAAGRSGIEGNIEHPNAIRGSEKDVYIAEGVNIHPMVVIDAEHGPIYIDKGVEIHPFTRIEGPCYIGENCILLGAKFREGNSVGPMCRLGGEVEESIILGHSNKYHDGFLGHAYVGEWVNLGALTTNSDLKNDYTNVSVILDGKKAIDTGSMKVGSLIGDHVKTSIGTLLNTGSYVGAMALLMATGKPLPKYIPSFSWFLEGIVTKGFGKGKLFQTANAAMGRRKCEWTAAQESMWNEIFKMTAPQRKEAVSKGRKVMLNR